MNTIQLKMYNIMENYLGRILCYFLSVFNYIHLLIHKVAFCINMSSHEVGNRFGKSQVFQKTFSNLFVCPCTNCCSYFKTTILNFFLNIFAHNLNKHIYVYSEGTTTLPSIFPSRPLATIFSICLSMPNRCPMS